MLEFIEMYNSFSANSNDLKGQYDLDEFKKAMNGSLDHVVITNPNGIVVYANPAVENTTGYTHTDIIGIKAGTLWGGLMDKEFYENMWKTIKIDKKEFCGDMRNRKKDGTEYNSHVKIIPILDESQEVKYFIGIEKEID